MSPTSDSHKQRIPARDAALKVAVVAPKSVLGGAELYLLAVLNEAHRIEPTVLLLENGPLELQLREQGIDVRVIGQDGSSEGAVSTERQMVALLASLQPDVVLANGVKAAVVAGPPARGLGIPLVWVRHDPSFSGTWGRLARSIAARTVSVWPSGPDEANDPSIHFLPPPLFDEPMDSAAARARLQELGVPDDGLHLVGMATRLVPYKGIDRLIEALALPGGQGWRLVVAGTPDPAEGEAETERLRELAARVGVTDRITWLGQVAAAGTLAPAYRAVAVPTRAGVPGYPDAEGFPLTSIEAMAAGVPVLGDPRCVPPLTIPAYRSGAVLVDSTDPSDLARGLAELADDDGHGQIAAAAAAAGAAHPRTGQVAEQLTDILAEAANRPGAGNQSGPAFSVIATVFNEGPGIDELVGDVVAQLRSSDEFVVVDGGSSDDTIERLEKWSANDPRVRYFVVPGAGISAGRNEAVRRSTHDWIAGTDAGCTPEPGWLDGLRRGATHPGVGLVTGLYEATADPGNAWEVALAAIAYPQPADARRSNPWQAAYGKLFGGRYDAGSPTGRCLAFTKEAWSAAGGFPEDLATAEDVLFGKRAIAAGTKAVLTRDAVVRWRQRETLRANLRMFFNYGKGGGQSGDRTLIARDAVRLAAYGSGAALLTSRRGRLLGLAGAGVYYSVPLSRTLTGPRPVAASSLVPVIAALRDLSKASGTVSGLAQRRSRPPS